MTGARECWLCDVMGTSSRSERSLDRRLRLLAALNNSSHLFIDCMPLVSVSRAQRGPIRDANFAATIYHGLPLNLLVPTLEPQGNYLAFLGRISPEKGVDRAIALARTTGFPLKIAAKVDRVDEAYFRSEIEPLLNHPGIEYVGEIDDRHKSRFLGEAHALLFPINWPEPFGLAMTCAEGQPATSIEYQREAGSNEIDVSTVIRIAAGSDVRTLQRTTPTRGDDRYQTFADRQFVRKALAAGGIVVTETFSPRNARPWAREIRLSTAGLEQALRTPLKNCGTT